MEIYFNKTLCQKFSIAFSVNNTVCKRLVIFKTFPTWFNDQEKYSKVYNICRINNYVYLPILYKSLSFDQS